MMVLCKLCVYILSSLVLCLGRADGFDVTVGDIHEILSFGREVITDILESYELVKPHHPNGELDYPFVKKMEKRMMDKMSLISQQIDDVEDRLDLHMEAIMSNIIETITVDQSLDNALRQFDHYVGQIENMYDNAVEYARAREKFEDYTIEKFAMACTSPNIDDLPNVIKTLHRLVVSSPSQIFNRSLLVLLAKQLQEASSQICNLQQSPQQLLYNLYKTITLTEIKGYSMIQFSYVLLRIYHQGSNFWEEMQLVKQQFNNRAAETLRAVKTAMAFAPRDVWRCDPKKHVANETYTELKQLFQGYLVNEVDLNSDNTCRETCGYYSYAKVHGCYKNQFCAQQRRCNGKIVNCEYIDSDMWICPSARSNTRRYEWIQYENGKVFGKKNGSCPRATSKVDSWWRWLFWHCSYCFCYCDDHNSNSDRYFSLRTVEADIANNKVVTGIRLLKKNQIIHMQIQEGQLLPRGTINSSSIEWKPVDAYTVFDHNVKSGVDYHTLVWEKRAIDMDDLIPPQDHLLTGVRFRMIGTRLNLEIKITPFNFTNGKLIQPLDKSYWYSNDVTERTELPLKRPDLPIRTTLENVPDSSINQYLNFAPSDKERDAAQSTIPFLDIQPVVPNPPVPIAGAGIFHKGRPSSGGFVAVKLFTYNFGPHLQSEPAPEEPVFDSIHNEIRAV